MKYLIVIHCLYFFSLQTVFSQERKKKKKIFECINFGPDISNYFNLLFDREKKQHSFWFDVNINRTFFFVVEGGITATDRRGMFDTLHYQNSGDFIRIGLDFNLIKNASRNDAVTLGFRYGRSNFEHSFNYQRTNSYWGKYSDTLSENNLQASWFELLAGVRVQTFKNLYLWGGVRFKVARFLPEEQNIQIAEIPGYGIVYPSGSSKPGIILSYHILYRIPFNKGFLNSF